METKPLVRDETWGSRRHILDWVSLPTFRDELNSLVATTGAAVPAGGKWMPSGWSQHREARLEIDGPRLLGDAVDWDELRSWCLVHFPRANTPNWDLAAACLLGGGPGLILVEAKAHSSELHEGAKPLSPKASANSLANDRQIRAALDEARTGLDLIVPGTRISADSHYQLSNRLAFAWWLAQHNIPVVLMYLGFLGDFRVGRGFPDDIAWQTAFVDYRRPVFPDGGVERWVNCGNAGFQLICRSRPIPRAEVEAVTSGLR